MFQVLWIARLLIFFLISGRNFQWLAVISPLVVALEQTVQKQTKVAHKPIGAKANTFTNLKLRKNVLTNLIWHDKSIIKKGINHLCRSTNLVSAEANEKVSWWSGFHVGAAVTHHHQALEAKAMGGEI
jgi:hypothetical protein